MKKICFYLFFIAFYLIWIIRATWFYSTVDTSIINETWRLIFANFTKFILWIIPAFAYVFLVDKENPLAQMKINSTLKRSNFPTIIIASSFYFAVVFLFEYLTSHRTLLSLVQAPLLKILSTLATVSISPVIEEIFFRGFVLHQLEIQSNFWKANIIQAFLFTAVHWPFWLWTNGFQIQILTTSVGIFILAIFLGWVLKKSKSVWPPVIVHIVNNLFSSFLA